MVIHFAESQQIICHGVRQVTVHSPCICHGVRQFTVHSACICYGVHQVTVHSACTCHGVRQVHQGSLHHAGHILAVYCRVQ